LYYQYCRKDVGDLEVTVAVTPNIRYSRLYYQYCRKVVGDLEVTVAVTPNGYADAVTDGEFVMPYEKTMQMKDFLNIIENPKDYKGIFYIQKQNSNLTDEFSTLLQDVDRGISWGTEAFGKLLLGI